MGGHRCGKKHPRRRRGARPDSRWPRPKGRARPDTPADPAQTEAQTKASQPRPRNPEAPSKTRTRQTRPDQPDQDQASKPTTQRTKTPGGARDQRGRLANRTQDHFRIAGLQHRAVLLPRKADEPGTISLVKLGGPRADEGHCLLSWTPPSFEDQRNQLPARGGVPPGVHHLL